LRVIIQIHQPLPPERGSQLPRVRFILLQVQPVYRIASDWTILLRSPPEIKKQENDTVLKLAISTFIC
jgi:hypothetical protein